MIKISNYSGKTRYTLKKINSFGTNNKYLPLSSNRLPEKSKERRTERLLLCRLVASFGTESLVNFNTHSQTKDDVHVLLCQASRFQTQFLQSGREFQDFSYSINGILTLKKNRCFFLAVVSQYQFDSMRRQFCEPSVMCQGGDYGHQVPMETRRGFIQRNSLVSPGNQMIKIAQIQLPRSVRMIDGIDVL